MNFNVVISLYIWYKSNHLDMYKNNCQPQWLINNISTTQGLNIINVVMTNYAVNINLILINHECEQPMISKKATYKRVL